MAELRAQSDDLDLLDASDSEVLNEQVAPPSNGLEMSDFEEVDDLQSLKSDVGDMVAPESEMAPPPAATPDPMAAEKIEEAPVQTGVLDLKSQEPAEALPEPVDDGYVIPGETSPAVVNDEEILNTGADPAARKKGQAEIFDVGKEERELLEVAKFVEGKIPEKEWDSIAAGSKLDKYVVQEGDWLWKISQRLFGSGFYYSKIWSLNPQITNPHEIEPGMTLVFSTGDAEGMPEVRVGEFGAVETPSTKGFGGDLTSLEQFGEEIRPNWLEERKKLIEQGVYFQYASDETYDDLEKIAKISLEDEFEKYDPPIPDIIIQEPGDQYDETGFDKNSRIVFNVKEGFFLNTFVTSNIVQDLGEIVGMEKENVFIQNHDKVYVKFDPTVKVKPGDMFSVYMPGGPVSHKISDRAGYKYTIGAQLRATRKVNQLWECEVEELAGVIQRNDRITAFTPKINRIAKTFNRRNIEAAIIDAYQETANGISFGDVVFLDRGRADGVEMGNVFELYSFYDRGTEKRLTPDPTYKIGEVTVITLTDNFATGLITLSSSEIGLGTIAMTKTEEQAALAMGLKNKDILKNVREMEAKSLDELDIELNLDDLSKNLLEKADKVRMTEDELEEIERQERDRSVIKDHERDLKELERLETEIMNAEGSIQEAKVDEDKYLEQQNLNDIEKRQRGMDPNAFESLNDIEKEIGLKFLDEDLNAKENPYGLTEFDLEEIDELLNTGEL
jgi:hypothetical protein